MTQIAQKSRRIRTAFVAIAFAVSRFRLPMPTMRERATEGRIVICQHLMNASLAGAITETRLPKKTPVAIPRMKPTSIQLVRFRRGSLMVFFSPCPGPRCARSVRLAFLRDSRRRGNNDTDSASMIITGVCCGAGFRRKRILPSSLFNSSRGNCRPREAGGIVLPSCRPYRGIGFLPG